MKRRAFMKAVAATIASPSLLPKVNEAIVGQVTGRGIYIGGSLDPPECELLLHFSPGEVVVPRHTIGAVLLIRPERTEAEWQERDQLLSVGKAINEHWDEIKENNVSA